MAYDRMVSTLTAGPNAKPLLPNGRRRPPRASYPVNVDGAITARLHDLASARNEEAVRKHAFGEAEVAADAAYNAVEDIVDATVKAEMLSKNDLAIKTRVLGRYADIGSFRPEDILQSLVDVQMFAAR